MASRGKLTQGVKIYLDDNGGTPRDITCDLIDIPETGITYAEVDMTGVCNTVANYLAGLGTAGSTLKGAMNDTATTGFYTILAGLAVNQVVTLTAEYGDDASAPTTGSPTFGGEYVMMGFKVSNDGGKMVCEAEVKPTGAVAPAWGVKS